VLAQTPQRASRNFSTTAATSAPERKLQLESETFSPRVETSARKRHLQLDPSIFLPHQTHPTCMFPLFFPNASHILIQKGAPAMYRILISIIALAALAAVPAAAESVHKNTEKEAVIIEVGGNPSEHKSYLNTYHPYIEVVHTYDTLFNGLALKAEPDRFGQIESLDFIKAVHPVAT